MFLGLMEMVSLVLVDLGIHRLLVALKENSCCWVCCVAQRRRKSGFGSWS